MEDAIEKGDHQTAPERGRFVTALDGGELGIDHPVDEALLSDHPDTKAMQQAGFRRRGIGRRRFAG